jgi:hypothetical protein
LDKTNSFYPLKTKLTLLNSDEFKYGIQNIVDMPDNKTDCLILFLHQNKGILSKRKPKLYKKLNDNEIAQIEQAYF